MRRKWQQSAAAGWSHHRLSEEIDRAMEEMACNGIFHLGRLLARVEDCQERDAEDANAEIKRLQEKLQELDSSSQEDFTATEYKLRQALQENSALRAELEKLQLKNRSQDDAQSAEEKLRHAKSEIDRLRKLLRAAGATEKKLRLALQENRALRAELEECND